MYMYYIQFQIGFIKMEDDLKGVHVVSCELCTCSPLFLLGVNPRNQDNLPIKPGSFVGGLPAVFKLL